jgi:hypothetical protein
MATTDPRAADLASRYVVASPRGWKRCRTHGTTFRDFCAGCASEVGFALARDAGDRFDQEHDNAAT